METTMKFEVAWSKPQQFADGNFDIDTDGVYIIGYRNQKTNNRYVVYVGQGHIGTRLSEHNRSNACIKKKVGQTGRVGYYRYVECRNEDDRLDIELGLYLKYGGSKLCNEIEPPGSGNYSSVEVTETFS